LVPTGPDITPKPSPLAHSTKADSVAAWLRNEIFRGALTPGMPLLQEELAKTLGVSSTPIREAFSVLESQGFLERRRHSGVTVADPAPADRDDLHGIAGELEVFAVMRVERSGAAPSLTALDLAIEESRAAIETTNHERYARATLGFHSALIALAESKLLADLMDRINSRWALTYPFGRGDMDRGLTEHTEILTALTNRDYTGAAELIRRHRQLLVVSERDTYQRSHDGQALQTPRER
jgi:DNA-binding GntR family transcriptional regulator